MDHCDDVATGDGGWAEVFLSMWSSLLEPSFVVLKYGTDYVLR